MRRPAVDLYLRNLSFEFNRDGVAGLPSGLIGLDLPHGDPSLLWFFHEVEHLTQLTHPLGAMLTALALHAIDLRNDAVSALSMWDWEEKTASKVIDACLEHRESVLIMRVLSDWMQPLLEGLALAAETDLDHIGGDVLRPPVAAAIFAQMPDWEHKFRSKAEYRELWDRLMAQDQSLWDGLYADIDRQIKVSRQVRRAGDLLDEVFWGSGAADATWPYFIGYLYVRQTMQIWQRLLPDATPEELHERVTKAVCSVLPMTILPLCSPVGGEIGSLLLTEAIELLARRLRELDADDVDRIGSGLYRIDSRNRLEALLRPDEADSGGGVDRALLYIIGEEMEHIFGMTEATEEHQRTASALYEIEWGKFVVPSTVRRVAVRAIDPRQQILLLVDESAEGGPARMAALTYFHVEDAPLRLLAESDGIDIDELPRVDLDTPPPWRIGKGPRWSLHLANYLHFWPNGVRVEAPLKIVRIVVSARRRAMYEAVASPDDRRAISVRDAINRKWAPNLAEASDVAKPAIAPVIERLVEVLGADCSEAERAGEVTPGYARLHSERRNRIYELLGGIVFGRDVDQSAIYTRRFGVLKEELSHEHLALLRRAMRNGLLLSRECSVTVTEDSRGAVEQIRAVATRVLGLPLVAWVDEGKRIVLDLSHQVQPSTASVSIAG